MQFNFLLKGQFKRIYLDHAAATPLLPSVVKVMQKVESKYFANPSAIHKEGVAVRSVVESAREKLARCLGVRSEGIIFTGSGTESNNLTILGSVYARHEAGLAYEEMEVITTEIEHPSVLETVLFLETLGVSVKYVPVLETGLINKVEFKKLLSTKTVLVTFAYVNSEVGVIQPVAQLSRLVHAYMREHQTEVIVHIDAAQAPLWLSCQLPQLQVDLMSLDAGKCGGPKGVGVVVKRHGVSLKSVLHGGPQEGGLRPATENTVGIVGAVEAIAEAQSNYSVRADQVSKLRDLFIKDLKQIPGLVVNGTETDRVANNVNVSVPGIDSEFAVISLDEAGIACSTKSACSGAGGGGSKVVMAMFGDTARAQSTIRFTLGSSNTLTELLRASKSLKSHIKATQDFNQNLTQK